MTRLNHVAGRIDRLITRAFACFAALLLVAACSQQDLYTDLSETQANDMVAALLDAGIEAGKTSADKGKWKISVPQAQFARAVDVLKSNGFPRKDYETLGTIFKKEGFASSPLEERARLNFGISEELSHSIREIDGVVEARVHLTMPEPDPLSKDAKPASASVFVKYRPGFDLQSETGAIKSLITNGVEGLTYDRVSVIMTPSRATPRDTRGDTDVSSLLGVRLLIGLIALALIGFAGRALLKARRSRRTAIVQDEG
jgi:type III secretion protein J